MAKQWYYKDKTGEHGPVASQKLKALVESGQIRVDDLVRTEGASSWRKAGEIKGLIVSGLKRDPEVPIAPNTVGSIGAQLSAAWEKLRRIPIVTQLREFWVRTFQDQDGEPFVPLNDSEEVFRGTLIQTMPTSLSQVGRKARVLLEQNSLVVVRKQLFGNGEFLVGRYESRQLIQCKQTKPIPAVDPVGFLYGVVQDSRNREKYGHFDGKAATNLQNGGKEPGVTQVQGIQLCFRVPEDPHEGHIFLFGASTETKPGSLKDAVFRLMKYVRSPTKEIEELHENKNSELVDDLKRRRDAVNNRQSAIADRLRDVRKARDQTRIETTELREKLNALKQKVDVTQETESNEHNIGLLKQLADLRDAGVLTDEEFDQKKQQLLDRI